MLQIPHDWQEQLEVGNDDVGDWALESAKGSQKLGAEMVKDMQ